MQSCCCWRSVRRGSFACAIYVGIYFIVLALTTGKVLQGESQYLRGNRSLPESSSFLESDTISPTTVWFNVMLFICSCCGVICNILLLYGLYKDQRVFLVPWIIVVVTTCFVDVAHSLYLFIVASTFDPTKVMLYTLNFFLFCLNVERMCYVIRWPGTGFPAISHVSFTLDIFRVVRDLPVSRICGRSRHCRGRLRIQGQYSETLSTETGTR